MYGKPEYDGDDSRVASRRILLVLTVAFVGLLLGAAYPKATASIVGLLSWMLFDCVGNAIGT